MSTLLKTGVKAVARRWQAEAVNALTPSQPSFANVVHLHPAAEQRVDAASPVRPETVALPPAVQDDADVQNFLRQDHAEAGRVLAMREPNLEALERAQAVLLAGFDNILERLASRHVAHGERLAQLKADLGEGSPTMTEKLRMAIEHNQRRVGELHEQRRLAHEGAGWYLEAAVAHSAGFSRGLRQALDIDKLFR
jgi:hypothetical protein